MIVNLDHFQHCLFNMSHAPEKVHQRSVITKTSKPFLLKASPNKKQPSFPSVLLLVHYRIINMVFCSTLRIGACILAGPNAVPPTVDPFSKTHWQRVTDNWLYVLGHFWIASMTEFCWKLGQRSIPHGHGDPHVFFLFRVAPIKLSISPSKIEWDRIPTDP